MNDTFRYKNVVIVIAGLAALAAGYFLTSLALPMLFPGMVAGQLDRSTQDVATFLQQARIQSIERNAPVECRIEQRGRRTVLWLDWNLLEESPTNRRIHPPGVRLELPSGFVLSQDGEPRTSGVIAIFNPRGGFTVGSDRSASPEQLTLYLSLRGGPVNHLHEVGLTPAGEFQARNAPHGVTPASPPVTMASQ